MGYFKSIKNSTISLFGLYFLFLLPSIVLGQNRILDSDIVLYTSLLPKDPEYKAIEALKRDIKKVLGKKSLVKPLSTITSPGIIILNSKKDTLLEPMRGWEAHRVYSHSLNGVEHIVLHGSDTRGTIYAIYTFSEKVLGVPPLWFFAGWAPEKKITIPLNLNLTYPSPEVKYRGWFLNDMDLIAPWRKLSKENNEIWLETALRLKLNVIEWLDTDKYDFFGEFGVSPTVKLIHSYGLVNTSHHHSPLGSSFEQWDAYWRTVRKMNPPELLLKNQAQIEEFWRYKIEQIKKAGIPMVWVLGFRGAGDNPFWQTFKDAPRSAKERGQIITKMLARQKALVAEIMGVPQEYRTILYNEVADLYHQNMIQPPVGPNVTLIFVAARRDHYPGKELQKFEDNSLDMNVGYYMNLQFTSTGSHLAQAEGPWKMEDNFRYLRKKLARPVYFSIVNVGNIREHLLSLSAHAAMMWNFEKYNTDIFVLDFCRRYFGDDSAQTIARLYKEYFDAFWSQKKSDLPGFKRQYVFQDLRYQKAISQLVKSFKKAFNPNPLTDLGTESVQGRTFNIVPKDNLSKNQIDALIEGTLASKLKFQEVANQCDVLVNQLNENQRTLFNDTLRIRAHFMLSLNEALNAIAQAYRLGLKNPKTPPLIQSTIEALKRGKAFLYSIDRGPFTGWYQQDRVFDITDLINSVMKLFERIPPKPGKVLTSKEIPL